MHLQLLAFEALELWASVGVLEGRRERGTGLLLFWLLLFFKLQLQGCLFFQKFSDSLFQVGPVFSSLCSAKLSKFFLAEVLCSANLFCSTQFLCSAEFFCSAELFKLFLADILCSANLLCSAQLLRSAKVLFFPVLLVLVELLRLAKSLGSSEGSFFSCGDAAFLGVFFFGVSFSGSPGPGGSQGS